MTTAFKYTLALTLLFVVVLVLFPEVTAPLEVVFYLAVGWIPFLYHTLPQVHVHWPAVLTALLVTAAFVSFAHTFARHLRQSSPSPGTPGEGRGEGLSREPERAPSPTPAWPLRWTLTAAAILLLTFTAGLAATGLTQHTARLLTADEPLFRSFRANLAPRVRCMTQLRVIGQVLAYYAKKHDGHYPARLDDLLDLDITNLSFVCPVADPEHARPGATTQETLTRLREGHATYVFLTPNLRYPPPKPIPVVTEPLANHNLTDLHILYSDGSVERHTPAEAQKILNPRPPETKNTP